MVNQESQPVVFTVGHSTRPLAEFIALLAAHSVTRLIDVRSVPRSRHNPQFNGDTLPVALEAAGIRYEHIAGLGGFRHTSSESPNLGWRNASFRGYADYMQSAEFAQNLASLMKLAKQEQVAIMCAEAVPWRCHRSLITIGDHGFLIRLHCRSLPTLQGIGVNRGLSPIISCFARETCRRYRDEH